MHLMRLWAFSEPLAGHSESTGRAIWLQQRQQRMLNPTKIWSIWFRSWSVSSFLSVLGNFDSSYFFKSWKVPVLDDPHEGFLKWGYPQIIHFKRMFHYKPSIWGYPHFGKPPHDLPLTLLDNFPQRISWLRTALHMACSWPEGLQALLEARRMLKGCWWVETKSDSLKWGTPKSSQICHAYQDFLDSFGISIILYCISQFCESQKWLPQREDQFWS